MSKHSDSFMVQANTFWKNHASSILANRSANERAFLQSEHNHGAYVEWQLASTPDDFLRTSRELFDTVLFHLHPKAHQIPSSLHDAHNEAYFPQDAVELDATLALEQILFRIFSPKSETIHPAVATHTNQLAACIKECAMLTTSAMPAMSTHSAREILAEQSFNAMLQKMQQHLPEVFVEEMLQKCSARTPDFIVSGGGSIRPLISKKNEID